ncbi:threonylcarbamoyl-AMP synthase [Paenibacillus sp. N10]|uniref:Threonylcarbamoyl-AMP synthase n=1 Tax=Paenibacillus lutrae TaxID=2078573 RepID=A0A7X3FMR4_9BACL|nr:threonylcarbamoyl-AMP synthase [Paenibacillus lutrae]
MNINKGDATLTEHWVVNHKSDVDAADRAISEAARLLRLGETVAFPTETVYGLGADATNSDAVKGIYSAKGRPSDNPLIVHIADRDQMDAFAEEAAEPLQRLMNAFWPGPLTIIVPVRTGALSPLVTAGLNTVGVRIPDHPVAIAVLRAAGCPVAAPSANSSGRPSPTTAEHVSEDLGGLIGGIVDGGATGVGVESTVVEWANGALYVLRPGGVTAEQLREALPDVSVREPARTEEPAGTPRAPGMKYTHYAPRGSMRVVLGDDPQAVAAWMRRELDAAKARGERTGVLTFDERRGLHRADVVVAAGSLAQPDTIARGLYSALRQFDQQHATFILAEGCSEAGIGRAIMNRLLKAAGHEVVRV